MACPSAAVVETRRLAFEAYLKVRFFHETAAPQGKAGFLAPQTVPFFSEMGRGAVNPPRSLSPRHQRDEQLLSNRRGTKEMSNCCLIAAAPQR